MPLPSLVFRPAESDIVGRMRADILQQYARDRVDELPRAERPVDPVTFGRREP